MDTSKTYIDMSNHPKIQKQWKPQNGDCYENGKGEVLIFPFVSPPEQWKRDDYTWLPRQDQIQEMVYRKGFIPAKVIRIVSNYFEEDSKYYSYFCRFKTFEQLWLAFYMYEKHKLTWNSRKWQRK